MPLESAAGEIRLDFRPRRTNPQMADWYEANWPDTKGQVAINGVRTLGGRYQTDPYARIDGAAFIIEEIPYQSARVERRAMVEPEGQDGPEQGYYIYLSDPADIRIPRYEEFKSQVDSGSSGDRQDPQS